MSLDFQKISLADFPAEHQQKLYELFVISRLTSLDQTVEISDIYEGLGEADFDREIRRKLVELMPRSSRLIELWNWDVRFEQAAFEDRDAMLQAVVDRDDDSIERWATALRDEWNLAIDQYGVDMALEELEEDVDDFMMDECRKFMRDWRENVLDFVVSHPEHFMQGMKDEYRNVRFRCERADIPSSFFIITAYNPDGITASDQENQIADEKLRAHLDFLAFDHFPVTGGNANFSHAEPGYGLACARQEALALARDFRQQAVFEIRQGRVFLISALPSPEPDEELGKWEELVVG